MKFIKLLKASWSEKELAQVNALDPNATGKYNIYQDKGGEIFITNHKLNNDFALMDTADTFEQVINKVETDWEDAVYIVYDNDILTEWEKYNGIEIELNPDIEDDSFENYGFYDLTQHYDEVK